MISIYSSACTTGSLLGTAVGECDLSTLGDLKGISLVAPNTRFLLSGNFATQYVQLIKEKKLFPLLDLWSFEQTTPDNETATSSVGVLVEIRAGKPQFTITYSKSHCWHKSVFEKKGFGNWGVILIFENRVVMAKSFDGLAVEPFKMGMFSVGTLRFQQGTDRQSTSVMIQLTDTVQFNQRMVALENTDLAIELNNTQSFINVDITYPDPPEAGTTVVVDVKSSCSGAAIVGLTGSGKWKLGGEQATPRTVTTAAESATVPGRYTLTLSGTTAEDDTIQPYLSDGTYNVVEDAGGVQYSGEAPLATI